MSSVSILVFTLHSIFSKVPSLNSVNYCQMPFLQMYFQFISSVFPNLVSSVLIPVRCHFSTTDSIILFPIFSSHPTLNCLDRTNLRCINKSLKGTTPKGSVCVHRLSPTAEPGDHTSCKTNNLGIGQHAVVVDSF